MAYDLRIGYAKTLRTRSLSAGSVDRDVTGSEAGNRSIDLDRKMSNMPYFISAT